VFAHIGAGPADIPEPPLRRQGDDRSARWVERYRNESPRRPDFEFDTARADGDDAVEQLLEARRRG
jgi:hypothetical protein